VYGFSPTIIRLKVVEGLLGDTALRLGLMAAECSLMIMHSTGEAVSLLKMVFGMV
jgi:hypothetical protein